MNLSIIRLTCDRSSKTALLFSLSIRDKKRLEHTQLTRWTVLKKFHTNITSRMSVRLFEDKDHAAMYSKYRPSYPASVYQSVLEFLNQSTGSGSLGDLAVDIGCGNGISTRPLSSHFRKVIGSDVSKEQITKAKLDLENVSYRAGPGEDLSFLDSNSVDLITVAQAIHWIDLPVFYREVGRVLKPGGVIAAYGYGNNIIDDEEANKLQQEFYWGLLSGCWDKRRRHIDNLYQDITPAFKQWKRNDRLTIEREWTVDSYIGYLSTWSGWRGYHKAFPDSDALDILRDKMFQIYSQKSDSLVKVSWPLFILMEKKEV